MRNKYNVCHNKTVTRPYKKNGHKIGVQKAKVSKDKRKDK